jgi:peptide/nickel transport system permease protein
MTAKPGLLPPGHHLAALVVASLVTLSLLAEPLVAPQSFLLFGASLDAVTDTTWARVVAWWIRGARYVAVASLIVALISTGVGLLLGWLTTIERRVSGFALRHVAALCGSLPSLVLVGVARISGLFPAGLDLILVLMLLRSVEAAHLVRTLLIATGTQQFTVSARSVGGSRWHVLVWHLWPHLSRPLAALAAATPANVVALETALSLIGLGIPNHASWGAALVASGPDGTATLLAACLALASLLIVAGASVILARHVRRDRWVEQRLV